ncbi:MAG TPA: UDP-2,3-diacylglucosamine diphosphatase, partial [Cytophagaceae bacterium]
YRKPQEIIINNSKFLLGHGDGLGPGDQIYKILKKVFSNKVCQFLFSIIPPIIGMGIAKMWSQKSRLHNNTDEVFLGDKEWLYIYCKEVEETSHHDYYIFGHRHLPLDLIVGEDSRYINLGEWIKYCTYASFDGEKLCLETFG